MGNQLRFNAERHEYTVGCIVLPSVTTIISAVGLYEFDSVPIETLEVAAERGRNVHTYIEWYEQGVLDMASIDPELEGYFNAYLSMKAEGLIPEKPFAIEKRSWSHKYRYAGTMDMLFNGGRWIHDHKTGLPSPATGLQLSAYWLMDHPDMSDKPERLTAGYLTRRGEYNLVDYDYEPLAWLAVFADYGWRVKNNMIRSRWRNR